MNYFAHGRRYTDDPYLLAGTATPDWLCVVDRSVRVRSKSAAKYVKDANPRVAAIARGIVQHHFDDGWFHRTRAFAELNLQLTTAIRECLADDGGFRSGFLGHILVELLLDAELIKQDPQQLDVYYAALDAADPYVVEEAVGRIAGASCNPLGLFIGRFSAERFLYDYADDDKLLRRLNHVMRRVQLPLLPPSFLEVLPAARRLVGRRQDELLDSSNEQDSITASSAERRE